MYKDDVIVFTNAMAMIYSQWVCGGIMIMI